MAYAPQIRSGHPASTFGAEGLFAELKRAWANRRAYHRTVAELNSLGDRELADLGLHRSHIQSIAHESVYGTQD